MLLEILLLFIHRITHEIWITTNETRSLCRNFKCTVIIKLIFECNCMILLLFLLFDLSYNFFVPCKISFLVSNHVTEFHLLFDQVFSLCE